MYDTIFGLKKKKNGCTGESKPGVTDGNGQGSDRFQIMILLSFLDVQGKEGMLWPVVKSKGQLTSVTTAEVRKRSAVMWMSILLCC